MCESSALSGRRHEDNELGSHLRFKPPAVTAPSARIESTIPIPQTHSLLGNVIFVTAVEA